MLHPIHVPAVFSDDECARIVTLAEAAAFADAGLVRGAQDARIRRARIAWLDEEGNAGWVFARIMETVAAVNRERFGFDLTEFAERMQVAQYDGDASGHFDWHADTGSGPFAARRKLTLVVQLSAPEVYRGGALETNADGTVVEADRMRGGATIFPSFVLHRVTPVTDGTRHSLTTWVHGPAFR